MFNSLLRERHLFLELALQTFRKPLPVRGVPQSQRRSITPSRSRRRRRGRRRVPRVSVEQVRVPRAPALAARRPQPRPHLFPFLRRLPRISRPRLTVPDRLLRPLRRRRQVPHPRPSPRRRRARPLSSPRRRVAASRSLHLPSRARRPTSLAPRARALRPRRLRPVVAIARVVARPSSSSRRRDATAPSLPARRRRRDAATRAIARRRDAHVGFVRFVARRVARSRRRVSPRASTRRAVAGGFESDLNPCCERVSNA